MFKWSFNTSPHVSYHTLLLNQWVLLVWYSYYFLLPIPAVLLKMESNDGKLIIIIILYSFVVVTRTIPQIFRAFATFKI